MHSDPEKSNILTITRYSKGTTEHYEQDNSLNFEDSGSVRLQFSPVAEDVASSTASGEVTSPHSKVHKGVYIPGEPVTATITGVERMPRTHPFNPNLYTIELDHAGYKWTIRRRYKHFLKMDAELFLLKVDPRQHIATHRGHHNLPRRHLPRRPDTFATPSHMEARIKALEKYLQVILENEEYRNHKEVMNFLEISHFSFKYELGDKGREGVLRKRAGGHRFPAGCCSFCSAMSCGIWSKRWFIVKDSFVAYVSQKNKRVRGVLLMDKDFTFKYGRDQTNVRHGLIVRNQARELLLSCWTDRKAGEFMRSVVNVMATTGAEWLQEQPHDSYAPVRPSTHAQWFVDGALYFESVALAMEDAKEEIFITDWWLSPELQLRRPVCEGNHWRLDQILKRKAECGVKVYILLYKEVELALTINSAYTKATLTALHPNIKVLRHPDHVPGSGVIYWAHHEKIVAIDQKIAFLGGLDLCFGRWDDHNHRLTDFGSAAPPVHRNYPLTKTAMEIGKIGSLLVDDREDGDHHDFACSDRVDGIKLWFGKDYSNPIKRDFFDIHKPYEDSVDRASIPRMPWHDIGVAVYGAAARDVARHFIVRWNATKLEKVKEIDHVPFVLPKSYQTLNHVIPTDSKTSTVNCQVLRSIGSWAGGIPTETSIMQAYLDAIHNAEHYIYIENQFFITSLRSDGVRNEIGDALFLRILRAHQEGSNFRVIVVMPLLPAFEGELGTPTGTAVGVITHWNYRSICKGSDSLLARLTESVGDPSPYISFYALRTHAETYGTPITELVYVHSKMMIVDDRIVIIGSANINDRSMLGKRDSEIAVRIEDKEDMISSVMDGQEYQAGRFAYSLRTKLFKEHLGLLSHPESTNISVEDPLTDEFYKDVWMSTAKHNTQIYTEVFNCLPCDEVRSIADLATHRSKEPLVDRDPQAAREALGNIEGHLVMLPLRFLENEDLRPPIGSSEYLISFEVFT